MPEAVVGIVTELAGVILGQLLARGNEYSSGFGFAVAVRPRLTRDVDGNVPTTTIS